MRQQRTAQSAGEMEVIREELTEILSELRRDVAYAEVQNSYGRIFVTAGVNPLPDAVPDTSLSTLSQAVAQRLAEWDQGEVGLVIKPLGSQFKTWTGAGEQRFAFDADTFTVGGTIRYTATQRGGGALPPWLRFDPATRTFSGNPPAAAPAVEIEVLAANDAGGRARDRFRLSLSQTNDAPVADEPPLQAVSEGAEPLTGRLQARDADGDPLTFALAQTRVPVPGLTLQPDGSWRFDPRDPAYLPLAEGEKRTLTLPIEVKDTQGAIAPVTLRIELTGRNDPPRWVTLPAPVEVAASAERAEGQLAFSDPDNGARLTVSVDGGANPAGFELRPDGRWRLDLQQPDYVRLAAGERREIPLALTLSDERGATARATLRITVVGVNDAPRASAASVPRLSLSAANDYTVQLPMDLFADPEGRPLSYQLFHRAFLTPGPLPAWLAFDAATLRLSVAADQTIPSIGARMTLVLTATDPEGAGASRTLDLDVEARPAAKP
jgi:VCBS repeat-containing protein